MSNQKIPRRHTRIENSENHRRLVDILAFQAYMKASRESTHHLHLLFAPIRLYLCWVLADTFDLLKSVYRRIISVYWLLSFSQYMQENAAFPFWQLPGDGKRFHTFLLAL